MLSQREDEDADAGSAAWMQLVGEWRARGSPPENVRREHGRSPGLRVNAYSLGLPGDEPPVTLLRESLAAYSCGVSSGMVARGDAPDSLFRSTRGR